MSSGYIFSLFVFELHILIKRTSGFGLNTLTLDLEQVLDFFAEFYLRNLASDKYLEGSFNSCISGLHLGNLTELFRLETDF